MRRLALVLIVSACAKAATPEVAVNPSRGLRDLSAADAEVAEIAIEAARSLPPEASSRPLFAGVFVNARRSRSATDAVVRELRFIPVTTGGTPVRAECRAVSSTGASTPVPCPAGATTAIQANMPPTYTFLSVRATADSAYVGTRKQTSRSTEDGCITLIRVAGKWNVLRTGASPDGIRCGQ